MKILTINTHSLIEENYEQKLNMFIDAIYRIRPDVIAMQEANQTTDAQVTALGKGFDVRQDNHALSVCDTLNDLGLNYRYFWYGMKYAYDRFQEGIAILTHLPVTETDSVLISENNDVRDWHTRYALGVCVGDEWFYCIHTGRCDDEKHPFCKQWQRFESHVCEKQKVWVMGDFNCTPDSNGYRTVINSGWYDTFCMANEHDCGNTVRGRIDGWHDKDIDNMRIDYIFTNCKATVKSSKVIFNGLNEEVVSDHYGVLVEV